MYTRVQANRKIEPGLASLVAIILILVSLFMVRFIDIALKKKVRGNLAYVQLLNSGMPILKGSYYNKDDFLESSVSIGSITLEAANLNGLNPVSLISYGIPFLKDSSITTKFENSSVLFDQFRLNDGSIAKINPEDIKKNVGPVVANVAYNPNLKKTLNQAKPEVLIYHTHTTESYLPSTGDSADENLGVLGVGNELTKELEQNYGISVIHDKTNHYVSFDGCYDRSGDTVEKYLKKYGDFKLIIDLHRDSAGSGGKVPFTLNINNESVAKIMFVSARNNPHYKDNEAMVNSLQEISNRLFPGFSRTPFIYPSGKGAFNQILSKNSVLIEVGAQVNTAEESKGSAKYIGRMIAEKLNAKKN